MSIVLTKQGDFVKVVTPNREPQSLHRSKVSLQYNNNNNIVTLTTPDYYQDADVTDCTFGGVVLSNENTFDTQVALLFPNEGGGSGGTITPTIKVTQANFTGATSYNNPLIVGKSLAVFLNNIPKYLEIVDGEYSTTSTGINIDLAGFDATANNYTFYITILN